MLKSNSNECAWNYRAKSALYKNPGYTSQTCPMYVYVYVCTLLAAFGVMLKF